MSQITTKWIQDGAITPVKVDSSGDFFVHGLDTTNLTTIDLVVNGNTEIVSDLLVDGTVTVNGDLFLPNATMLQAPSAAINAESLYLGSGAYISSDLIVGSDATINGNTELVSDVQVDGTATINGDLFLPNATMLQAPSAAINAESLYLGSGAYISSDLIVGSDATINGNTELVSDVQVDGSATINGDLFLPNATMLQAPSAAINAESLYLGSGAYISSDLIVGSDATINGNTELVSDVQIDGNATVNNVLDVLNELYVANKITVTNGVDSVSSVTVQGPGGSLNVTPHTDHMSIYSIGDLSLETGGGAYDMTVAPTGVLQVITSLANFSGDATIGGNLQVEGVLGDTSVSGPFRVSGQVSVFNGNISAYDGNIYANTDIEAGTSITSGTYLYVGTDATIVRDTTVGRDERVARDLWVGRDTTVSRNLQVLNDATISNNASIGLGQCRISNDGVSIGPNIVLDQNGTVNIGKLGIHPNALTTAGYELIAPDTTTGDDGGNIWVQGGYSFDKTGGNLYLSPGQGLLSWGGVFISGMTPLRLEIGTLPTGSTGIGFQQIWNQNGVLAIGTPPAAGNLTITITGSDFSAYSYQTGTMRWTRVGKIVSVYIPLLQGTSNSTTLNIYPASGNWPSEIVSSIAPLCPASNIFNNSVAEGGYFIPPANSLGSTALRVFRYNNANFTASGGKGNQPSMITFIGD